MFELDMQTFDWKLHKQVDSSAKPKRGKQGHTANLYKGQIVYFGGEKSYNRIYKWRMCTNDTRIYDIKTKEWRYVRPFPITSRRNHAAVIIDNNLLVYGGIDSLGQYNNDLWSLNLKKRTWKKETILDKSQFIGNNNDAF